MYCIVQNVTAENTGDLQTVASCIGGEILYTTMKLPISHLMRGKYLGSKMRN